MVIHSLTSLKRATAIAAIATTAFCFCAARSAEALTYSIDDGTAEDSVGAGAGSWIFLNSFSVSPGNNIINSISIAFGTPLFPDPTLNGLSYTAVLWSDPNGDGLPNDGAVLASAPGTVSMEGTNTFLTTLIPATAVLTPNFFVGFIITQGNNQFPAGFDTTAPVSNRSYFVDTGNINDLSTAATIESFGLDGNWMIRADSIPEPSTYALVGFGAAALVFASRRARRHA
jgi:PEP-CTERM motif-containing protein